MLKSILRDAIPSRLQVPLKYFYNYARGWLEPEMDLLPKLVSAGDRVIDIGGNRGVYAYALAALGTRLAVFEPNPQCLSVLNSWAAGKDTVDVYGFALSSEAGQRDLYIPVDAAGHEHDASATLGFPAIDTARSVAVNVSTLDSFNFQDVKFIKIDVEGHELDVLAGASLTISTSLPVLLIEIEQRHNILPINKIFSYVDQLGYCGYYLDGGSLKGIDSFDAARDQQYPFAGTVPKRYVNNFLFVPAEHARFSAYAARLGLAVR
jgi:FkbM family methyltransferase